MSKKLESSTRGTGYHGLSREARITRAGKALYSAYRIDQFGDAEGFALQCAVLFEKYEIEVVEYLTDVRNSACLQLQHKFPPTLQEIKEALDEETARRIRLRTSMLVKVIPRPYVPPRTDHGCRANLKVLPNAPQFPTVKAFVESGEADPCDWRWEGDAIWVSLHAWNGLYTRMTLGASWHAPTEAELRALYGKREAEARAESAAQAFIDEHEESRHV